MKIDLVRKLRQVKLIFHENSNLEHGKLQD